MSRSDSAKPVRPDPAHLESGTESILLQRNHSSMGHAAAEENSEFAELAAKFTAHAGGKIPPELSGKLVLDILLNELVEQACLTTGATGAAVALAQGDEMICRASCGGAPELGAALETNSGLSGACVRTHRIQRCDDALVDPTADAEVARQLRIRSIVVLPLMRADTLIGVVEVFSERQAAFVDRDLQTLEALAQRIVRSVHAQQSSPAESATPVAEEEVRDRDPLELGMNQSAVEAPRMTPFDMDVALPTTTASPRSNWATTLMGVILLAGGLLMMTVLAIRMGWLSTSTGQSASRATTLSPASSSQTGTDTRAPLLKPKRPAIAAPRSKDAEAATQEGDLRVYENGKEIFRLPSDSESISPSASEGKVSGDSAMRSASIVEVAPDTAEASLVNRVEPHYPEQALARRIQGPVILDVHINREGYVVEINLVKGDPLLADAAATAVRQWKFKPHTVNGRLAEMQTQITLNFILPAS